MLGNTIDSPSSPAVRSNYRATVILLILASGLAFCHGCHGDEDNELLARSTVEVGNVAGSK